MPQQLPIPRTCVSTTMSLQPWDLMSTTSTVHQHSLTEPLFTSCSNTISRMRQLNVLFVTTALFEPKGMKPSHMDKQPKCLCQQSPARAQAETMEPPRAAPHVQATARCGPFWDRIQGEQFAQETCCCTQPKKPNHRG